jgi:multidrug efflux pump subunit AcrB
MPRFALRNPYLIVVLCLVLAVVGLSQLVRMPVDLFPPIRIPEVVVATFYTGMPPEEIETEITGRFERFFTLGSGIEHMESRSLPGVSLIKIYFQPGTDPDADVTMISNLAMANLRRLPPGTLPPVVMKFDASSLPVCLVTLEGQGLSETALRDLGQFAVRNQLATVAGASVPPPFGGKYRQIMVYVDPLKLQAYGLSPMDVVRAVNRSNLILPAGDAKIGPYDYNIYTNSQISQVADINTVPVRTVGDRVVTVADLGRAEDAHQIQTNIVRVNGERSVYIPILKQGGDTNTIAVVDGVRQVLARLYDVPRNLIARVVFDQSQFVRRAVENLIHEAGTGLLLTALMVLVFLGSLRATLAVSLSIPLSALATFLALSFGGSSINTMVLAGLALAFSRLIDNSVIVLENIFRHLEEGSAPPLAAEYGGQEVAMAVLAATLTTAVVFFPVTFLYGVARFLFSALALAVVLSLGASYFVAMTVVPLFCAHWLRPPAHATADAPAGRLERFHAWFNRQFAALPARYEVAVRRAVERPRRTAAVIVAVSAAGLALYPLLGQAFFPRTDAGQFVMNLKAPSGTRLEVMDDYVRRVEALIRQTIPPGDLKMIVSNIGVIPGFSSLYTSNAGPHTATVQVALTDQHRLSSYEEMERVRQALHRQMPELRAFFQSGGLVDAILNQGLPAPIDVQVTGPRLEADNAVARQLARRIQGLPGVSEVYIPQDLDYPALRLDVDRIRAGELGLDQREVVDNLITALTSNGMIAPSYWIDPRTGNDYLLTVQFFEDSIRSLNDLLAIPLRGGSSGGVGLLGEVTRVRRVDSPTEIDHYQIQRVIDVYVNPAGEDLSRVLRGVQRVLAGMQMPGDVRVQVRGMAEAMQRSFRSFAVGLVLAVALLYLILVAQFRSFLDPLLILLAVPTGLTGVVLLLLLTGTTLNVMSLMGVVMMVGIVVSNSILIVEFAHRLREQGRAVRDAVIESCRIRLRPILMTSLATIIGLLPMALRLGTGSEAYAPLARAIIGGLTVSVTLTVFLVPAVYVLVYGRPGSDEAVSTRSE